MRYESAMKTLLGMGLLVLSASNVFAADVCVIVVQASGTPAYAECTKSTDNVSIDNNESSAFAHAMAVKRLIEKGYEVTGDGSILIKK
jgi:hypothetical protein